MRHAAAWMGRVAIGFAIVGVLAWLAATRVLQLSPRAAGAPRIFTLAGAGSQALHSCRSVSSSCGAPSRPAVPWSAAERWVGGNCLTTLPDGTILLCDGGELLALSADGMMRHWPAATQVAQALGAAYLVDADAAPDGSVMVLASGLRNVDDGVARVQPDGTVQRLTAMDIDVDSGIAALRDGGAWIANPLTQRLVRVDATGKVIQRRGGRYSDVTALPDGTIAFVREQTALSGRVSPGRVLHLDARNRMTVLAGGGRGFTAGAKGTDVDLDYVWTAEALRDGAILIGAERGLLRLDRGGRIHKLADAGAPAGIAADDPRAVNDDGRYVRDVRLTEISRIATLDGRHPLVLTAVPGPGPGDASPHRLALIAPIARVERLAVALPRHNRTLLRHGRVEIVSTRPATARIRLLRGRHMVLSRTISLRRGRTRLRLRVAPSSDVHVLRVVATTATGATAMHQLAVIPSGALARPLVARIENAISLLAAGPETDAWLSCRRRTPHRYACVAHWVGEGEHTSRGILSLRDDGLIRFRERASRRVRHPLNLFFEPLTYDPRPD